MNKTLAFVASVGLLLAACGPPRDLISTPQPSPARPSETPPPTATPAPIVAQPTSTPPPTPTAVATPKTEATSPASQPGQPLPFQRGKLFSASGNCAVCHSDAIDASGADVSIPSFWRSTMMANAARDPYWEATVRAEVLSHPALAEIIEDKCAACHTPMARFTVAAGGGKGKLLGDGVLDPGNELHTLGVDGVSCTLCHQIGDAGLGEPDSFSGGYVIDAERPTDERIAFGPNPAVELDADLMQAVSGFIPRQAQHIQRSELCATCHTLHTPFVDAKGQVGGVFPEQMAYFEWLSSDYRQTRACQDCHMPEAQGEVQSSIVGGPSRSAFSQHAFVGGNAYMVGVLRDFGEELEVTASTEHFNATIARTVDLLQSRAAKIGFQDVRLSGSDLTASVVVESQVGHKFPTGFPSRRLWLHFTVRDAAGNVVFESGGINPDGSIVDNDNDADSTKYESHYLTINRPDQVQIYETIMRDTEGDVTTTLLKGAGYVKDNRLLPSGFDKGAAAADFAVHGQAAKDEDFVGGKDVVRYAINLGDTQGPVTVAVELLYQSIGYRWAENLRQHEANEIARFLSYYEAVPNLPVAVTSAKVEVGK